MIGEIGPRRTMQDLATERFNSTGIHPIEPKHGEFTWKGRSVRTEQGMKNLMHANVIEELLGGALLPVIKISRDDQGLRLIHAPHHAPAEVLELRVSSTSKHIEVDTETMEGYRGPWNLDDGVKDPSRLKGVR